MGQSQRERIIAFLQQQYGAAPEYLWASSPQSAVFRHPQSRKWYAVLMEVRREKLGVPGDGALQVLDLKCDPLMTGSLLLEKGFFPAYHMNKAHWVSVALDGQAGDARIFPLLEMAFGLVAPKSGK